MKIGNITSSTGKALRKLGLFENIPDAELKGLLPKLGCVCASYANGESLLQCCAASDRFWVLQRGIVHIFDHSTGTPHLMTVVYPGETFGEPSITMPELKPCVSIVAYGEVETVSFCSVALNEWRGDPKSGPFFLLMERRLCERMLEYARCKVQFGTLTAEERIMEFIRSRCEAEHSDTVRMPFNEDDFSKFVGVHKTSMSRLLRSMREKGLISFRGRVFKVRDMARKSPQFC